MGRQGVSPGTGTVKASVNLKNGVHLWGDGPGVSVLKLGPGNYVPGGDYYMVRVQQGNNGCGLHNLTLHGNRYEAIGEEQTHLVRCEDAYGFDVFNCEFLDIYGDGLKGLGTAQATASASKAWQFDESAATYTDITTAFNDATTANVQPFPASEAIGDALVIGESSKFDRVRFDYASGTAGSDDGTCVWEYWNGSAWAILDGLVDGTNDTGRLGQSFRAAAADDLAVTWKIPNDWATTTLGGSGGALYYVRARLTAVYATNPVLDRGYIARNSYCAFRAVNCLFRGIGRGAITFQRVTNYCLIYGCRFEGVRGQSIDYEPSGAVSGEEPIHTIISNCVFDNRYNSGAGYKLVALSGLADPGDQTVKVIFANNQIINGALEIGRVKDLLVSKCFIYGHTAFPAVEFAGLAEKVTFSQCHIVNRNTGTDPVGIKAEGGNGVVTNSNFVNCIVESPAYGMTLHGAKRCTIIGCQFIKTGAASGTVGLDLRSSAASDGLIVTGCTLEGWDIGVRVNNNPAAYTNLMVKDNNFKSCTADIDFNNTLQTDLPVLGPNMHGTTPLANMAAGQYYKIGADYYGSGTPETFVTAGPGQLYRDVANGEVYVKDSGTGNTNWKLVTHA